MYTKIVDYLFSEFLIICKNFINNKKRLDFPKISDTIYISTRKV